jgi:hypothetical protein
MSVSELEQTTVEVSVKPETVSIVAFEGSVTTYRSPGESSKMDRFSEGLLRSLRREVQLL